MATRRILAIIIALAMVLGMVFCFSGCFGSVKEFEPVESEIDGLVEYQGKVSLLKITPMINSFSMIPKQV